MTQPRIPRGTRDFGPEESSRRHYIFSTLRSTFEKFGYQPIETPALEMLSTLTGKYGEEGDKLIFKVLNSGDFLQKAREKVNLDEVQAGELTPLIAEKALRYDLTVPFARYVVQHQQKLSFPFKRYQIQPVWRADRPQKGRYREFYQCDVDVIGSDGLLNELELVQIYDDALSSLGLEAFTVHLNHRRVLSGLAGTFGLEDRFTELTVAIDKLDKIGAEGVQEELRNKDFPEEALEGISRLLDAKGDNAEKLRTVEELVGNTEDGQKGIREMQSILEMARKGGLQKAKLNFSPTLARGLDYYTGTIFEVSADAVKIGSIGGGGRYDDLTGVFGLKGVSGVGISFGAERIYDVLEELDRFPPARSNSTRVLFINFGADSLARVLELAAEVREQKIPCMVYPDEVKMKKQMRYADRQGIPHVVLLGEEEQKNGQVRLKEMDSGAETTIPAKELPSTLKTKGSSV